MISHQAPCWRGLENFDFEVVDKEMAANEAAQASQAAQAAIVTIEGNVLEPTRADGGKAGIWTCIYLCFFFFFFGAQYVFGLLILSPKQYLLPSVFGLLIQIEYIHVLPAYFPTSVDLFFVMLNTSYLYIVHAFCLHLFLFTPRLGLHPLGQNSIT